MKIILTGSTGFVGGEVLQQCLKNPTITSVVAVVRRNLPESVTKDPKLKTIILKDFNTYPDDVLQELSGAEACVWCLGGWSGKREIDVGYTMAGAKAFAKSLAPKLGNGKKFRFVYTSGMLIVRDQKKPLWILPAFRRLRGETENELIALAQEHPDVFEAYIAKPAGIYVKDSAIKHMTMGLSTAYTIRVDELALAMIDVALNGNEIQTFDNATLKARGKALM